jgi:kynureninase
MTHRHKVKVEEGGEKAIEDARRAQLKKEVSKRLGQPGAIADLVRAQVVRLGFTPQEVHAEMFRQSQG